MTRLVPARWSRLACAGALAALVGTACGGESSSDGSGGSGGSSGSAGGSKAGNGGSGDGSGGKSSAGTGGSSAGTGGSSAGTRGNEAGEAGSPGSGGTGGGTGGTGGSAGEPPDIPINQMCEDFEPCGGDPEGSWTIVDTCLEVPAEVPLLDVEGCEDAVEGVGVDVVGTRTYANGEVTFDQVATVRVAVQVSDACATAMIGLGTPVNAVALCEYLPALAAANMDSPFERVDCGVDDGECRCDLYMNAETTTTTTTYVVDANRITQGDGAEYDFCQEGDSLIAQTLAESEMTGGLNELTVKLERQ